MKLILQWFISASALLLVAYLYSGVQFDSFGSALIRRLSSACSTPYCARCW